MNVRTSAAQRPALRWSKNVVGGGIEAPFCLGLDAVLGGAEYGDSSGRARKEPPHPLRDDTEGFFAGGASLEQTAEFADLSDGPGLRLRFLKQSTDGLIG